MVTMGGQLESPPDYSGTRLKPYDHTFPPNWGPITQSKLASQIAGKWCQIRTVVSTESLWGHTITLHKSTIVDPLGAPLPPKLGTH